ncbi:putative fucosyltransferase domain protein [Escherichia coli DEC14D]|nr:putative fucosyltransferase domain protein [Escherichia coli DEC14D]
MFRKHYVEKSLEYDPDIDTKSINKKSSVIFKLKNILRNLGMS